MVVVWFQFTLILLEYQLNHSFFALVLAATTRVHFTLQVSQTSHNIELQIHKKTACAKFFAESLNKCKKQKMQFIFASKRKPYFNFRADKSLLFTQSFSDVSDIF